MIVSNLAVKFPLKARLRAGPLSCSKFLLHVRCLVSQAIEPSRELAVQRGRNLTSRLRGAIESGAAYENWYIPEERSMIRNKLKFYN